MLNKMDRLVLELQLTPEQAYERLKAIITQVDRIISAFQSERYISEADAVLASQEAPAHAAARCNEFFCLVQGMHVLARLHAGSRLRPKRMRPRCLSCHLGS